MVTCNICGYQGSYTSPTCPSCGTPFTFSDEQIRARLDALTPAMRRHSSEDYAENCRILCDLGHPEGIRLFGALLEELAEYERAAEIYRAHAPRHAFAAYRYATLLMRADRDGGYFWMRFASQLGCKDSFVPMARMYEERGHADRAMYYYHLAAACDSTEAVLALVRLYAASANADGASFAKWYLSRLPMKLLRAPRLSLRLRGVVAAEPPTPSDAFLDPCLYELKEEAERRGERRAYATLCQELCDRGHTDCLPALARLLIAGDGCERDAARGLALLHGLTEKGDTAAAVRLGDLYQKGDPIPKDLSRAMWYYQRAADFGDPKGYERLGDIYRSGADGQPRVAHAIELYERGAALGGADAARKVRDLKNQRESYYRRALQERNISPKDAYRHFVAAADMGYAPAEVRIGDCYLSGCGVPQDRRRAYLWYTYAAERKNEEAYYPLALCYARGVGVAFHYKNAMLYLRRAYAAGCEIAATEAERLLKGRMKKKERALRACVSELLYQGKCKEAVPLAFAAAELGDPKAQYTYAAMLEFGAGTNADTTLAQDYYRRAAEGGYTDERGAYKRILLRQINRPAGSR